MTDFHHLTVERHDIVLNDEVVASPWIGSCTCGVTVYGGRDRHGADQALREAHAEHHEVCS